MGEKQKKEYEFPEYLNSTVASRMLGISRPTLAREVADRCIRAYVVRGRYKFKKVDIDAYIASHTTRIATTLQQSDYKYLKIKDVGSASLM